MVFKQSFGGGASPLIFAADEKKVGHVKRIILGNHGWRLAAILKFQAKKKNPTFDLRLLT
jgi:hypothetical protein